MQKDFDTPELEYGVDARLLRRCSHMEGNKEAFQVFEGSSGLHLGH